MYKLNNNFELYIHVKIGDWKRKRGRHHCWPINPPPSKTAGSATVEKDKSQSHMSLRSRGHSFHSPRYQYN